MAPFAKGHKVMHTATVRSTSMLEGTATYEEQSSGSKRGGTATKSDPPYIHISHVMCLLVTDDPVESPRLAPATN